MMHDSGVEDIQVSPPPAKRQRKSQRKIPKPSSEQPPFWFYDGDIIIGVEGQSWKIHRSKLMCSVVFADMLELPQPSDVESMHGCPLVTLSQDSAKDWLVVLRWLYERDKFDSQTVVFDTIAGALRISNKYDITDLHQWSTCQLLLRWPQDLTKMTYTAFPHAAEAICLARECDVPEILPAAFYALSIVRWSRRAEGGLSHLQLSPADLRCFIVGREELQDHLHSILSGVDERTGGHTVLCDDCENATLTWLSSRLQADASSPYGTWLLRDLQDIAVSGYSRLIFAHYLCEMAFCLRIKEFINHLQEVIPRYFMLRT
ncbi:hypothetical protein K503DRAFT_728220 [Rhizopogon vinicolor AM-OR11-026]|uniref:BTB domain-containing protein n=1 Tax=Rhizopogon vinicolor AM-OR11-026 TaxID=1314800 RepID=A0A1B7MDJ7_9AGAM|nr:hypothetical protein K503DRAFT_728220 [Rhizopogon vinicolor AM-OR11-026]